LKKISLYFHTLKYLKLKQFLWRIKHVFFHRQPLQILPEVKTNKDKFSHWHSAYWRTSDCWNGENDFSFLNETRTINTTSQWQGMDRSIPLLWLYNLHYLDCLQTNIPTHKKLEMIARWIENNPPGVGPGWAPYPLSLRIVNWIKFYLDGGEEHKLHLESLYLQARWLRSRLEYHLLGNHLFANLKALLFAGFYFSGPEALEWRKKGLELLNEQVREQILPDGAHFELSPMYHCIILEDLLDLVRLEPSLSHLKKQISSMLNWLKSMTHPDGEISFFNDATMGIAASPLYLMQEAAKLGCIPKNSENDISILSDSGFVCINGFNTKLIFDTGKIGPDYIPGHAHADCLSFEFSLGQERVFVNQGTSVYGNSSIRLLERKTKAHNTVEVNQLDSSEVWHGFRVARRARPVHFQFGRQNGGYFMEASHDGYTRVIPNLLLTRKLELLPKRLKILDSLSTQASQALIYWHLHPEIKVEQVSDREFNLSTAKGFKLMFHSEGSCSLTESWYSSGFGVRRETLVIVTSMDGLNNNVSISW